MNDLTLYKLIYEIQNNYQQYKDLYEAYKYKPDENIMNEMQKLNTTLKQQINQYNSIDKEKKDETMINIDETNTNGDYQVYFGTLNGTSYQRPYIDTDNSHFNYNPATAHLHGFAEITATKFDALKMGISSKN